MTHTPYREALPIGAGDLVGVYRWLKAPTDPATGRMRKVWSVCHVTRTGGRGKLIGQVTDIALADARPVTSAKRVEAMRKAAAEGKPFREVVAWVVGTVTDGTDITSRVIGFDAATRPDFFHIDDESTWNGAQVVTFSKAGMRS